jgi:hypothetical protein
MNQACHLTLLLLAILLAMAPVRLFAQQPANACRLEANYDRETDTTTVECDLIESFAAPTRLIVQANASFQGKEPNESAKFWLGLSAYRSSANRRTPPLFKEAATFSLLTDAVRIEIPVTGYRKDFFELNRLLAEQARAEISREDLRKLLDAKSLAGKWESLEFKFSGDALASLKDFISRQVFVAHSGNQQR